MGPCESECRSAQVQGVDKMLAVLENALEQYNESNAVMDLVLFEDAMKHIARISRADSEQKMNLNLIWWRRWRRCGRQSVDAPRERVVVMVSFRAGLVQALHDLEDAEPPLPAGGRHQDHDHQLHRDDGGPRGPAVRSATRRPFQLRVDGVNATLVPAQVMW